MERGALAGFIGDLNSDTTLQMAQLLSLYGYTQISYGARDTLLSDRKMYPNFFRTVPDDEMQYVAIAKLLERLKWNWVGILTSDDEYGEREIRHLSKHLSDHGICIEFKILVSIKNYNKIPPELRTSTTEVLIICGSFSLIYYKFLYHNVPYYTEKTFIIPDSWSMSEIFFSLSNCSLAFTFPPLYIKGLLEYFYSIHPSSRPNDPLMEDILISEFQCFSENQMKNVLIPIIHRRPLRNCSLGKIPLDLYFPDEKTSYRVYISVYILAQALHDMDLCLKINNGKSEINPHTLKYKVRASNESLLVSFYTRSVQYWNTMGVTKAIEAANWKTGVTPNLSRNLRTALNTIRNNDDLVIKPSDKGGNIVVMDRACYEDMCYKILNNRDWYRPLPASMITQSIKRYRQILNCAQRLGIIDDTTLQFLNVESPTTPTFYASSKIHKVVLPPPGRPIVSGCGLLTENISRIIDEYLYPHVQSLFSHVKDTIELLKIVDGLTIPPNAWLVAIDIEALYNSIPHGLGTQVVRSFLNEHDKNTSKYNNLIIEMLEFILMNNILFSEESRNTLSDSVLTWHHYIDNVFMFWAGSKEDLVLFLEGLQTNHYNLKFTYNVSQKRITFLDVELYIDENGLLCSTLYRKPTAGNSLLHATSSHPKSLINSIPYSQYLRLRQNCSHEEDYRREAAQLYGRLKERGYSKTCLRQAFNKASTLERNTLIYKSKADPKTNTTRVITWFNRQRGLIRNIYSTFWHLLTSDDTINKFVNLTPEITFKRSPSIRDKAVSSHYAVQTLSRYVKEVQYKDQDGDVMIFNGKGELPSPLDIVNWVTRIKDINITECMLVGHFDGFLSEGQQLTLETKQISWNGDKNIFCGIQTNEGPPFINGPCVSTKVPRGQCSEECLPGFRKSYTVPNVIFTSFYSTDSELCKKCPENEWPNKAKTICSDKVIKYLSYEEDILVLFFSITSVIFATTSLLLLGLFVWFRITPIVRANNRNLSFILLLSLILSFLSVFLFLGRPVDITCMLQQVTFGIPFTISASSILAKTIMVFIAFKATRPGSSCRKWVGVKLPNTVMLFCSSIQVMNCILWLFISPPFQEYDMDSYPGKILIQCNEGSVIGFYSMLGYMGFLAAVSFLLAFMVRTLPDSFNEAKYITFSMLVFCSVWIAMIPAYLSTRGKYMVAVEVFAILTSSAGILLCMFSPKLYILLFKPELNTRGTMLGKRMMEM
ncbi:extracellular calcium-sensing receptor-like [Rana temporaria]|uniref:extracellular calcium-sensing receptor-like n=1 Tax=Rana temporaria TaxID=8407 RepID=UPI001AAC5D17|nr:extracellular calcium-sensing receptor-like [Rana temporaria]